MTTPESGAKFGRLPFRPVPGKSGPSVAPFQDTAKLGEENIAFASARSMNDLDVV
jgi:hypothetical protein